MLDFAVAAFAFSAFFCSASATLPLLAPQGGVRVTGPRLLENFFQVLSITLFIQ